MTLRSRMSLMLGVIGLEQLELFALELKKNGIFHFVYTVAYTNINKLVPNFLSLSLSIYIYIYMNRRPRMSFDCGCYRTRLTNYLPLN